MKRWKKYLLIILSTIIMMVAGLLWVVQTQWFQDLLTRRIEALVNQHINGRLEIGRIEGNLLTHVTIRHLTLTQGDDSLLRLPSLALHYSLTGLLSHRIDIDSCILTSPGLWLTQNPDSSWNFQHLMRPTADTLDEDPATPFAFTINVGQFAIREANLTLRAIDSIIPRRVSHLNLNLQGSYATGKARLHLQEMQLTTHAPDFRLDHLSLEAEQDSSTLVLKHLHLVTPGNRIDANGRFTSVQAFEAHVNWPDMHPGELTPWVPPLPLKIRPSLKLHIEQSQQHTMMDIVASYQAQSIGINGEAEGILAFINNNNPEPLRINATIDAQKLVPSEWLEMSPLPLSVTATLRARGNGLTATAPALLLELDAGGTRWQHLWLRNARVTAHYRDGDTGGEWHIDSPLGQTTGNARIDLHHPDRQAVANVAIQHLQLHRIIPAMADSTVVNATLQVTGSRVMQDARQLTMSARIYHSHAMRIPIDSLMVTGSIRGTDMAVDTLIFENPSAHLAGKGTFNASRQLQAWVTGTIDDTRAFDSYFRQPATWHRMTFALSANGTLDSLAATLSTQLDDVRLDTTLQAQSIALTAEGRMHDTTLTARAQLRVTNSRAGSLHVDSLTLAAHLQHQRIEGDLAAWFPGAMSLRAVAHATPDSLTTTTVETLSLQTPQTHLHLANGPATIDIGHGAITTNTIRIVDDHAPAFAMTLQGHYARDSMGADIDVSNLALPLLHHLGIAPVNMQGTARFTANVNGTPAMPEITVHTQLDSLKVNGLSVSRLTTNAGYRNHEANVRTAIYTPLNDSLTLTATLPMTVALDSSGIVMPQTFTAGIRTEGLRLSPFYEPMPPNAAATIDMNAHGLLTDPVVNGNIRLHNGEFAIPQWGIRLNDALLVMQVNDKTITLDSLYTRNGRGYLLAQGTLHIDSTWLSPQPAVADLRLRADNFQALRHRDFDLLMDADVFVKMNREQSTFGGDITIPQSSFNLDAIMGLAQEHQRVDEPLLVTALKDTSRQVVMTDTLTMETDSIMVSPLMERLTGSLRVNIPRNTWIRSDEMQMELYGNLDVVKNGPDFELFGTLGVHRGFYTLYGKRFVVDEGELTFSGGKEMNPGIGLTAHYIFRDSEKKKRQLNFSIEGSAQEPQLAFTIDGSAIPESDAVAYLLFGRPFDELAYGNRETTTTGDLSTRALGSLVASQLSKTLGHTLQLDMIEIDAGDNWQNTTFMVGKYITNNLFVTYRKDFGSTDQQTATPDIITLEYEIGRRLSLRLVQGDEKSTGADVILKFESKK